VSKLITILASASGYTVREELFEGRKHLVVPLVMMVEGVHSGSGGAFYYSAEELATFAVAWNGEPVTVPHPSDADGNPISANDPQVLEKYCIGRLFNAYFDDDGAKLKAEAWIDVDKAREISPVVLATISSTLPMEVSLGLFFESDGTPGEWKGEQYQGAAYHFRPDHVALLPDQIGACSIQDGCGVRVNADKQEGSMTVKTPASAANADPAAGAPAKTPEQNSANLMEALKTLKVSGFAWAVNVDISHDSIRCKLQEIVNTFDNAQWLNWVRAVYDDYFIYEARGHNPATGGYSYHLYKRDYTMNDTGVVTLGETVTEVIEETVYTPVTEMATNKGKEKLAMNKAKVDALIANKATRFVECDRAFLETLSEEQLAKLEPMDPPAAPPTANAEPPKVPVINSVDDLIKIAPEPHKTFLTNAIARENAAKKALVDGLLANSRNTLSKEKLEAMSVEDLEALARLGAIEVNYEGKGGASSAVQANAGEVLDAPRTFETKAA
jgi:hypothetical protein